MLLDFDMVEADKLQVLYVEDNPADVDLFLECLEDHDLERLSQVYTVSDGVEAMEFLSHEGSYENAPVVDLVFLDLNLPRKSGTAVLADIQSRDDLKHIPVVVLTSSNAEDDIIKSYRLQASAYVQKPRTLAGFEGLAAAISGFWFRKVKFPPKFE